MIDQVIDLSRYNVVTSFQAIKNAGILGVIHKATHGQNEVDARYIERVRPIRDRGLMHGAYHFGTAWGNGHEQALHFLDTVQPDERTLLALDWEPGLDGFTMSLANVRTFVETVYSETERWPLLYSGHIAKEALGRSFDSTLSKCPLWLAQYNDRPTIQATWPRWTFWQYSDKDTLPGVIGNVDRNRFNGDVNALRQLWGYPPLPVGEALPTKSTH